MVTGFWSKVIRSESSPRPANSSGEHNDVVYSIYGSRRPRLGDIGSPDPIEPLAPCPRGLMAVGASSRLG